MIYAKLRLTFFCFSVIEGAHIWGDDDVRGEGGLPGEGRVGSDLRRWIGAPRDGDRLR